MPRPFSNLPNEILLIFGQYLPARDLYSLARVSRHLCALFIARLRSLALKEENTHAAMYFAAVSGNRVLLKHILEKGENIILRVNGSLYRSPGCCSEWLLAWVLNGHPSTRLDDATRASTAISWAVRTSHLTVLRLLLDRRKIGLNATFPALAAAATHGNEKVVKLLLDRLLSEVPHTRGKFSTLLKIAVSNDHVGVVKLLLAYGANSKTRGKNGMTVLHIAAGRGHTEMLQLLLDQGADKDARNNNRLTALCWAVNKGHKETAQLLLDQGADKETKDEHGFTALHWAAQRGHREIIQLLLDRGVENDPQDLFGMTALHWAANSGYREIVQLLLDQGADKDMKDDIGRTALDLALRKEHKAVLQLLGGQKPIGTSRTEMDAGRFSSTNIVQVGRGLAT